MKFEWDEKKNISNQRKHGVSFEEAARIFQSRLTVFFPDDLVEDEERWIAVGTADGVRMLMVVYVYRDDDGEHIRIISARKLGKNEVNKWL